MEDVKKKGRMEFVYDEKAAAAKMERELATIEVHSKRFKYHREQEKEHEKLQQKIKLKVASLIRSSDCLIQQEFDFLFESI